MTKGDAWPRHDRMKRGKALSMSGAIVFVLMMALAAPAYAVAQTVIGTHSISFGNINRSATMSVHYSSPLAAQFTITGRQRRTVRLTVTSTSLSHVGNALPITITTHDCAYSINGGATWTAFSSGALFQDVVIPNGNGNGNKGSIYVRVGGTIAVGNLQTRGTYTGSVTVSATYR